MRIVQAVVLVAPPALILWMGGTYLLDCGRLLLAPGVPVALDYKSPEGPIRLWADGYRIDPDRRTANLWGLSAKRANGQEIASVQDVQAGGLDPFALRPDVRVRGVRAHLERDEKGFDLARLLPKKEGPPSTIPYSVTVLDAQVEVVDRTFKKPVSQVVRTARLAFDGVGDDWRAQGRVSLPGIGDADVRAQSLPNVGITADLDAQTLRLERLATTLVPGLRAQRITAYGPVRIDVPKTGAFRVATTMRAQAQGLVYQGYAVDDVSFQGRASELGLEGAVAARVGAARVRFEGSATRVKGGGRLVASVPSPAAIPAWARKYLPPKAGFRDAAYDGWVAWEGKTPRLDGDVRVGRALYGTDVLDALRARVAYGGDRVDVRGATARWRGAPLAGDLSYDLKTRAIRGAAVAPRVELAALARRLGRPDLGLGGTVGGTALVSGALSQPQIEGSVSGRVALKGRALGGVEARGAWLAGAARIDRLKVSGPLGAVVAGGTVRPDGTLALHAEARGLRVERLVRGAKGLVSANLNVGGTLRDPHATGRLEAYRLAYGDQDLPAAALDLVADRRRIDLRNVAAVRGTARLRGRVGAALTGPGVVLADPRTWLLDGRLALRGVQANELPGAEGMDDLAGLLSIPRADLSGRLGNPTVRADLRGDGLVVRGIRMDAVRGEVVANRKGARVASLEAAGAGGRMTGGGAFDFDRRDGTMDLSLADVQLSRLLSDVSEEVTVDGTVSAPKVHLTIRDGKPFGQAEGTLSAVTVNGVLAGDGNWSLDATGERVKAVASVGRIDPTLRALDVAATYNVVEGSLAATVQAKDLPLQALVAAVQARRTSSESEAQRLATVAGDLSGAIQAVRTKDGDLKIAASDLQAASIRYLEIDYGTLTAGGLTRRGRRWTLDGARLVGGAGTFALGGSVEEDGPLDLQASGEGIRLAAFSPFAPTLAEIVGTARFSLAATGTVRSPVVKGSASVDGLLVTDSKEALSVSLDEIEVGDGGSRIKGVLRYGDRFGGLFTATAALAYRADRSGMEAAPIKGTLNVGALALLDPEDPSKGLRVDPVNLADVPGLGAYIDVKRGGGTLTGSFGIEGTYAQPRLTGGVALLAPQLGIAVPGKPDRPVTKVDDLLRDVSATLGFDERNAPVLNLSTRFERGGTLTAMATLGDLGKGEGGAPRTFFDVLKTKLDWKTLPLTGFADASGANRVTLRQNVAGGTTRATIEGRVEMKGQAVAPDFTGAFELSDFETTLPSLAEGSSSGGSLLFDPTFDITLLLAKNQKPQPGRFRTATADLWLLGDVSAKGSLSNPRVNAEFLTDRGSIRLPGGVVRVDRGGQISFAYRPAAAAGNPASANISLQGRSGITVARQGLGSQRYDVTLDMNGDLLQENGLKFEATSDPGDLTQAEILNALGGTQFLQGLSEGGNSAERGVRNAFAGFALPALLDPLTSGFVRSLGFDYLTLEYNEYDQATVAFGTSLPLGFSFQGRRQVGEPPPGFRAIYDLRLSYSPRAALGRRAKGKGGAFLDRLTFSLGTDQDRPWKASTEYGTRFGQRGGQSGAKHVLFPSAKGKREGEKGKE